MHAIEASDRVGAASIPRLGFGTVRLYDDACVEGVLDALEIGYRYIDTAQAYNNEEAVGRALAATPVPRDQVFLVTKLDFPYYAREALAPSLRESLDRLQTEYVDLLLMHWPHDEVPMEETLEAMGAAREQGLLRHFGVSNFTSDQVRQAADCAPIATNQVEYHPFLNQDRLLETHRQLGILTTAYSPLARGALLDDPVLSAIGADHGKSVAQVALRWLLQQDGVITAVRSSSAHHRVANFDVFDFTLDEGEMERIAGLARGYRVIDPPFAPDWDSDDHDRR
jgi:diketogulonate reductase-like aldo/keto reductase